MTRTQAMAALLHLAASISEPSEGEAVARLLERISSAPDPELLRDALVELGARELLRP
jgi:hypothetical protein